MCLQPHLIKNPNRGRASLAAYGLDVTSQYIEVPCGVCPQCIRARQIAWVQRVQMEALEHHLFFCTITYNNECMPSVATSTGYFIRYVDVRDIQLMFKRLRKSNAFGRPFRHFSVTELGTKKGRPHAHLLLILPKYSSDTYADCLQLESVIFRELLAEWRRNYGSCRVPDYRPCCTYVRKIIRGKVRTNFDVSFVNSVTHHGGPTAVAFYVLKYMLKPSKRATRLRQALHLNLPEDEYNDIWSLVRPRHFESEGFGLGRSLVDGKPLPSPAVRDWIRHCVDLSLHEDVPFPRFYSPDSGQSFPLCKYYKRNPSLFTLDDFYKFYYNSDDLPDNVVVKSPVYIDQALKRFDDFDKQLKIVDSNDSLSNLDELFDDSNEPFLLL